MLRRLRGKQTTITLRDIDGEAGFTPMTECNVIHKNYARVSPATIEKVRAIIDKYRYVPNMAARSLVGKSSKLIAVMMSKWQEDEWSPMFSPYVAA